MHAFTKFKFAKRVFLLLSGKIGISYKAKKQDALRASIQELEDSVSYIDWKQNFYDEVLSGKRPYVSNLIRIEE